MLLILGQAINMRLFWHIVYERFVQVVYFKTLCRDRSGCKVIIGFPKFA